MNILREQFTVVFLYGTGDGTMATPRIDECSCQEHTYCQISSTTGNAVCVPDCSRDNGGCSQEQNCEVETFNCTPHNSEPCDPSLYVRCRDPPYGECLGWENGMHPKTFNVWHCSHACNDKRADFSHTCLHVLIASLCNNKNSFKNTFNSILMYTYDIV